MLRGGEAGGGRPARDAASAGAPSRSAHVRAWPRGPARPVLGPREVHVWRADLDDVSEGLLGSLSERERERASHIISPRKRERWMRSQAVLRDLLARYVECDPGAIALGTDPRGKPTLIGLEKRATASRLHVPRALGSQDCGSTRARRTLHFSVSHCGHLALYALATGGPVGVDIQLAPAPRNAVAIAGRARGSAASERLRGLDLEAREREFLRLWVRYEAEIKLRGVVSGTAMTSGRCPYVCTRTPWIHELAIGEGAGAVAWDTSRHTPARWEWY